MANDMNRSRRSFLKGASVAGVLGLAGCLDQSAGGDGDGGAWTLGTSSEGSSSFAIGSNWTEYASQNDALDFEVDAVITEGTGASYRRMDRGDFELSGTTTQLLAASPDTGPYEDEPLQDFDNIRQIRGYMGFYNFGLYNADEVDGWDDLEGSSVAISSAGSGTRPPVEWLVDQEVGMDNIDARYMAFADMPAAMRSGQIDAMFTWTVNKTNPQGAFQEVDATVNWEPLPISEATRDKLQNDLAYLTYVQLDEDTVAQNTENYSEPLDTFTLTYLYVAKADRDDDRIYDITKFTYENGDELVDRDSVMGYFPDPDQFMGQLHPDIPVHKGAYDYYTEEGLWEDYDLTPPPEA
ncbi:TRAP-type uncharacterized transport system periplasmic component-like protein (plasmid) [Halorubrum lacusprofundi ATCC 49239]|jgi:hypothetical protein|uniref:TRAP-type uncharacterized transport system periplasmic component-like protein n=1 Tax=Halorubrum lacusprofundi (strain ATCC 49239 / DSM 5036 / JCM 8891 / ACAM 34) TaxID=416348 RepID=B9LX43_HALLT|nr:substrate-binding domain-containing protein [Halorubrum lacusprofundi]ACM59034.1 TRAP-type uncharacterized transport system periplasmic component-like protein [Halorubrum lacusprofundi ATCC 49239]